MGDLALRPESAYHAMRGMRTSDHHNLVCVMLTMNPPIIESVTAHNHVDAASHLHRKYKGCAVKLVSQYDYSGLGVITYTFMVWTVKVTSDARNVA